MSEVYRVVFLCKNQDRSGNVGTELYHCKDFSEAYERAKEMLKESIELYSIESIFHIPSVQVI